MLTAEEYLVKADPILGKLVAKQKITTSKRPNDYFESLCRSIIGQQVSVKAAETIYGRFEQTTKLSPEKVRKLTEEEVKQIGLSRQKASYLSDLAEHFYKDSAVYNHLDSLSDDDVIKELTAVKGIGVWTAQMFLMFTLNRPDVFAPDDIGLIRAIEKLYKLEVQPTKAELIKLAEKWKPYRTTACLHLWHSLDNAPKP